MVCMYVVSWGTNCCMKGCVSKHDEKEHLTYHYILANHPGISGTVPEAFKIVPDIIHVTSVYTKYSRTMTEC